MTGATPAQRLEQIRASIRAESVSYGELAELADLAEHIEPGDVELAEWAGIPEHDDIGAEDDDNLPWSPRDPHGVGQ